MFQSLSGFLILYDLILIVHLDIYLFQGFNPSRAFSSFTTVVWHVTNALGTVGFQSLSGFLILYDDRYSNPKYSSWEFQSLSGFLILYDRLSVV